MRFWLREVLGWLFMLLGLALFALCILFVNSRWVVEGSITAFVGFILFRTGIHFLKIAVAARIYMNARNTTEEPAENEKNSRASVPANRLRKDAGKTLSS